MKKICVYLLPLFMSTLFLTCIKQKFDHPPDTTNIDPALTVNSSIWLLKQKWISVPVLIEEDILISGIVVADDRSGNFYKQIIIQDTSSGIAILLGRASLYNDYPIGRRVYVNCKGLYLGAYGGFVQLGSTPDIANGISEIPGARIGLHLIKGSFLPDSIKPKRVSISQLNDLNATLKLQGTLVQIDSAQFFGSDIGQTFAQDPSIASGTDRKIEDCAGINIVMRNSGYANFRAAMLPSGKGLVRAIFSRYNNTPQLLIRDTNDVKMIGPRCNAALVRQSIASIRKLFTGSGNVVLGNGIMIKGIVISDKSNANIDSKNIVLQDESGGIVIRFASATGLPSLGDEVEINISGETLSEYPTTGGGVLQIGNLQNSKFIKTGTGNITPRVATISQIHDSSEVWESTLVKINQANITGGTTYSGSKTVNDGTGAIILYTVNSATFANSPIATSTVSITGIVGQYTTSKQISIRKLSDIQ